MDFNPTYKTRKPTKDDPSEFTAEHARAIVSTKCKHKALRGKTVEIHGATTDGRLCAVDVAAGVSDWLPAKDLEAVK